MKVVCNVVHRNNNINVLIYKLHILCLQIFILSLFFLEISGAMFNIIIIIIIIIIVIIIFFKLNKKPMV
jgi:hypothetical protein